ncbi:MAG: V-type ATPase subunit, partial [Nitrospinota bacterium]|nr:V-type ATPase subunit [Nitrospinota bacterium]
DRHDVSVGLYTWRAYDLPLDHIDTQDATSGNLSRHAADLGVALRARLRGADRQEARGWLAPGGGLSESLFLEAIGGTGAGSVASWAASFGATVLGDLVEGLQQTQDEAEAGRRLERLADDHLTELVHAGKYISFGPEPLVGYLHGIEMEVKNVRRLLDGLAQGEETKDILADLRRSYV